MIDIYSLSPEWLDEKIQIYKKSDPTIMERVIFALYLLEQLGKTNLDFIFKGGTSLILLLKEPSRFSVDIDIVVNPTITQKVLETYLEKVKPSEVFTKIDLDEKRSYKEGIPNYLPSGQFGQCSN